MARKGVTPRRRPTVQITEHRAARLHRLIRLLGAGPRGRKELLEALGVGLRTFYRELEMLRRCGVGIRTDGQVYRLTETGDEAEGLLPFPDPRLSFAEMEELSRGPGPAARRLAGMLQRVVALSEGAAGGGSRRAPRRH